MPTLPYMHHSSPYTLQPYATVYSWRASVISCARTPTLRVVSASGIGIGQLEQVMKQDPDRVRADVCALERQEYYHLPDHHAHVLRRCIKQEEAAEAEAAFSWARFVQRGGFWLMLQVFFEAPHA